VAQAHAIRILPFTRARACAGVHAGSHRYDGRIGRLTFTAKLAPHGPAAAFVLDDEQVAAVGEGARRFPVRATVNGYTWRTTVVRMHGEFLLGLNREVRAGAGVEPGDTVTVEVELDAEPREVDVPSALADALAGNAAAAAGFDRLSYTHRKEYARWIAEAKRDDTRARRVAAAIERLGRGQPPP